MSPTIAADAPATPTTTVPKHIWSDLSFTVDYAELREALDHLKAFTVGSNLHHSLPILDSVLFTADGGNVSASFFDYETSVELPLHTAVTGKRGQDGRTLVARDELTKLIAGAAKGETKKALAEAKVEITPDGTYHVVIATAGFEVPVESLNIADYPQLPTVVAGTVAVEADALLAALERVGVSRGKDATLPMLTGVAVEVDGDDLILATTDRFRLGVARIPFGGEGFEGKALLPARGLTLAVKRLAEKGGRVTLGVEQATHNFGSGRNQTYTERFTVFTPRGTVTSRGVDAEFPRWRQLLPADGQTFQVDRAALELAAVKAQGINAARGKLTNVTLKVSKGQVEVCPEVIDGAKDKAKGRVVAIEGGDPDGFVIAFNGDYLVDALGTITDEQVTVLLTTPSRPGLFYGVTEGRERFQHLLMPVRLPG